MEFGSKMELEKIYVLVGLSWSLLLIYGLYIRNPQII